MTLRGSTWARSSATAAALSLGLVAATVSVSEAAQPPRLTGRVVDFDGRPMGGVPVSVSGPEITSTTSRVDGTFSVQQPEGWSGPISVYALSGPSETAYSRGAVEGVEVAGDTHLGDLAVSPLVSATLQVTDPEGDAVARAQPRGEACVRVTQRPDLGASARQSSCAGMHRSADGGTDGYGRARMELPQDYAAEVIDASTVTLTDPATGDVHVERLSDAVHDAASNTYRLTVPGIDAPPAQPPAAPAGLSVRTGPGGAAIGWKPSEVKPGTTVRRYDLTVSGTNGVVRIARLNPSAHSHVASGLTIGLTYTVSVTAVSDRGNSEPATREFIMAKPPSTPGRPFVAVTGRVAKVRWGRSMASGGAPVRYRVTLFTRERPRPDDPVVAVVARGPGKPRKVTFRRLEPGRYQVQVRSLNVAGQSSPSVRNFVIRRR